MQRRTLLQAGLFGSFATYFSLASFHTQAHAQSLTPVKMTLDFRVTSQTAPFFLAQSKGYFAEEGLDVQIDVGSGSVASITRVASGAYDLGLGDMSALMEFRANNADAPGVKAVYQYYNRAPFVIIGRKDKGIDGTFASLKGKRVAAAAVESTRRAWPLVADQMGVGHDFFEWVTTDFSARDNLVVRGDVDAATYFHDSAVSLFARLPQEQLSILEYVNQGVNLYGNAIIASQTMLSEQPQVVEKFLRATHRAALEMLENPTEGLAAIQQREPLLDAGIEAKRWAITREYLAAPETTTVGLGGWDTAVLQTQLNDVGESFGFKSKPAIEDVVDTRFLEMMGARKVAI